MNVHGQRCAMLLPGRIGWKYALSLEWDDPGPRFHVPLLAYRAGWRDEQLARLDIRRRDRLGGRHAAALKQRDLFQ